MSSIGSNQSSKRWELVSIAECESSGLLVTFFMAWSPARHFNAGDSRLITTEATPPSIPTNPATGPFDLCRLSVRACRFCASANAAERLGFRPGIGCVYVWAGDHALPHVSIYA